MMQAEKARLLSLLSAPDDWCRDAEARDASGVAVRYSDEQAVAWDITGAVCRLFGWKRACVLFRQIERHLIGRQHRLTFPAQDPAIQAMKALQDYNDRDVGSFEELRAKLERMPVWTSPVGGLG